MENTFIKLTVKFKQLYFVDCTKIKRLNFCHVWFKFGISQWWIQDFLEGKGCL